MRQIILDTETTGISVDDGHRLIEIGCLEMNNRKLTGARFHCYINPEREVEAGAVAVHGITSDFLRDKPVFTAVVKEFMEFITGAELIIHNAPFDVSFINHELMLTRQGWKTVADYCGVIDTLQMARKLHVGQRNSLDALCKRYGVDNSKRDLHGALLDANLLAQVYLAMTGGQGSFFDAPNTASSSAMKQSESNSSIQIMDHQLVILKADEEEVAAHKAYLEMLKKQGKCAWDEE